MEHKILLNLDYDFFEAAFKNLSEESIAEMVKSAFAAAVYTDKIRVRVYLADMLAKNRVLAESWRTIAADIDDLCYTFEEGRESHITGKANPYEEGTTNHAEWCKGYDYHKKLRDGN
jgi:hypothetical protein